MIDTPWLRQNDETEKEYDAWLRDHRSRRHHKEDIETLLQPREESNTELAEKWDWDERSEALDREQDRRTAVQTARLAVSTTTQIVTVLSVQWAQTMAQDDTADESEIVLLAQTLNETIEIAFKSQKFLESSYRFDSKVSVEPSASKSAAKQRASSKRASTAAKKQIELTETLSRIAERVPSIGLEQASAEVAELENGDAKSWKGKAQRIINAYNRGEVAKDTERQETSRVLAEAVLAYNAKPTEPPMQETDETSSSVDPPQEEQPSPPTTEPPHEQEQPTPPVAPQAPPPPIMTPHPYQ